MPHLQHGIYLASFDVNTIAMVIDTSRFDGELLEADDVDG